MKLSDLLGSAELFLATLRRKTAVLPVLLLAAAVGGLRRREEHVLFVHGGDFFRSAWDFERAATDTDVELWNRLGLEAAVLGNHEFDRGPGFLADHLASRAEFPLLSANVDVIVGGHSHSLLGTFEGFGWFTWAEYPKRLRSRDGEPVLVVQAGRWGDVLGVLSVEFDREGLIQSFDGHARALAGDTSPSDCPAGAPPAGARWNAASPRTALCP